MKQVNFESYNWCMRKRYLNRQLSSPGTPVNFFLKPVGANGPDHDQLVEALKAFGFDIVKVGDKRFSPIELRLMWRNLRDWSAWLANVRVYQEFTCPIFEASYSYGDTLQAMDFVKKEFRKVYVPSGEHVRNLFHAPENAFEVLLHKKVMREQVDLPNLTPAELAAQYDAALKYAAAHSASPAFYSAHSMLLDDAQRTLKNGLFGLCAVTLARDNSIRDLTYLGETEWTKVLSGDLPDDFRILRFLYDATFVAGDPSAFLQCYGYYEERFCQYCYTHILAKSSRNKIRPDATEAPSSEGKMDCYLDALLPPPYVPSKIATIEGVVLNDWVNMQAGSDASLLNA